MEASEILVRCQVLICVHIIFFFTFSTTLKLMYFNIFALTSYALLYFCILIQLFKLASYKQVESKLKWKPSSVPKVKLSKV